MWSGKLCTIVGLSAILSCITLGSAEAERINYAVNGHKYWYNSKSKHGKELAAKRLARGGGAGHPTDHVPRRSRWRARMERLRRSGWREPSVA